MKPRLVVLVTGTGTGVGKTWVSAETVTRLRSANLRACARKPVQSYDPTDEVTDADVLSAASGEPASTVCPQHRWYPVALAPPMAAAVLCRPEPHLSQLIGEVDRSWPNPNADVALVEGAGGVASPIAVDGDSADLARGIAADLVVLVADAGLGTINAVRLSHRALEPLPVIVYLNRFDHELELHSRNGAWLSEVDGLDVCWNGDDLSARIVERLGS